MSRIVGAIAIVALLIALTFGQFAYLAFPIALIAGLIFGIPIALLLREQGWTAWWMSLAGGIVCSLPVVFYYLSINSGHTAYVGPYNSIYALEMGAVGGIIFWIVAIFRNPSFPPLQAVWPKSLVVAPVILAAMFLYRDGLEPVALYGCITSYDELDNPTAWAYSEVSILTDEGQIARATLTQGYSNPEVVGNCVRVSKRKNALLSGFSYFLHSPSARGCGNACPNDNSRDHEPITN